jgi:hypothetical protein
VPNLLAKGQALLARLMKRDATSTGAVTYRRGAETLDLTGKAWVGRTVFTRIPREGGAAVAFGDRDYLVVAADLVFGGEVVEPRRGDRIVEVIAGVDVTFEVVDPFGEPAWRWSDPGRTVYRIHTKEVAV